MPDQVSQKDERAFENADEERVFVAIITADGRRQPVYRDGDLLPGEEDVKFS
jgi:hypothetical protein